MTCSRILWGKGSDGTLFHSFHSIESEAPKEKAWYHFCLLPELLLGKPFCCIERALENKITVWDLQMISFPCSSFLFWTKTVIFKHFFCNRKRSLCVLLIVSDMKKKWHALILHFSGLCRKKTTKLTFSSKAMVGFSTSSLRETTLSFITASY